MALKSGNDSNKYMKSLLKAVTVLSFITIGNSASAAAYIYKDGTGKLYVSDEKVDLFGYELVRVVASRAFSPVTRSLPTESDDTPEAPNLIDETLQAFVEFDANKSGSTSDAVYIDGYIHQVAKDYHMDPALIKAVIHVESNFDVFAKSRVGAIRLMQIMPNTGTDYELYDPYDPLENIRAGTQHLRFLLDLFDEDVDLAIAAYNAGQGNVLKYDGIPPFPETINYVRRVSEKYELYRGGF